jgi:CDP-diglyceride synthetase
MLAAGALARFILLRNAHWGAECANRIDEHGLNLGVLAGLTALVVFTTYFWGFVILLGTTLLGLVAPLAGVRRANAMGMFLVPTMLFFSGWRTPVVGFLRLETIKTPVPQTGWVYLLLVIVVSMAVSAGAYWVGCRWKRGNGSQSLYIGAGAPLPPKGE